MKSCLYPFCAVSTRNATMFLFTINIYRNRILVRFIRGKITICILFNSSGTRIFTVVDRDSGKLQIDFYLLYSTSGLHKYHVVKMKLEKSLIEMHAIYINIHTFIYYFFLIYCKSSESIRSISNVINANV